VERRPSSSAPVEPHFAGGTFDFPGYAGSISVIEPTRERPSGWPSAPVAMAVSLVDDYVPRII